MGIVKVERVRFSIDWGTGEENSRLTPETQLQNHLQFLVDNNATIVSVQQTHCERADPRSTDTYIKWIEVLIITLTKDPSEKKDTKLYLQVGRFYKNRSGSVVQIVAFNGFGCLNPFKDSNNSLYDLNGRRAKDNPEDKIGPEFSDYDLVEEVTVEREK